MNNWHECTRCLSATYRQGDMCRDCEEYTSNGNSNDIGNSFSKTSHELINQMDEERQTLEDRLKNLEKQIKRLNRELGLK